MTGSLRENLNGTLVRLHFWRLLGTLHFLAFPVLRGCPHSCSCLPLCVEGQHHWPCVSGAISWTLHASAPLFQLPRVFGGSFIASSKSLSWHRSYNIFCHIPPKSEVIWWQVLELRTRVSLREYSSTSHSPSLNSFHFCIWSKWSNTYLIPLFLIRPLEYALRCFHKHDLSLILRESPGPL